MNKIVACWRFALVFVFTIICLFLITCVLPGADHEKRGRIVKKWSSVLVRWLGARVVLKGGFDDERVHATGFTPGQIGRLIVSNHVSFLDIFVLNSVLPSSFVAKAEIAQWPVFGKIASAVGTIFIERGRKRALLAIGENMQKALEEGRSLLVFPEGTTSDGTALLKLHGNLFESAVRSQCEVRPVVMRYKSRGEVTTAPSYVGDTGLFECLWNVVCTPDLTVEVHVLDKAEGEDRHAVCKAASASMCAAIGCPDPLAPAAKPETAEA